MNKPQILPGAGSGLADQRGLERQWNQLLRRERRLLRANLDDLTLPLNENIPEKLRTPLESAFCKGFAFLFEKGMGQIQKMSQGASAHRGQKQQEQLLREWSGASLRQLDRKGRTATWAGFGLSAAEGTALGLVGLGIPDIPVMLAGLLGLLCSIAGQYGYPCDTTREQSYLLAVLSAAAAPTAQREALFARCDRMALQLIESQPLEAQRDALIEETAALLTQRLLLAKAIQGMAVVGVAGGLLSSRLTKQVGEHANLKYQKRFLLEYQHRKGIR